ncbi:MAG TPA: S8 family serine peptidase, partial [Pyrinomonadaceae bacterium]|nr:S8 family serine peptidase [Pyrinomonadaceae bacterium]
MSAISAKEADASRPKYLIIFEEPSEDNTSTLSTVLKRGKAAGVSERAGISMLAAANSGVETKVYEPLGIAAADLSDTQVNSLRKRGDVRAVVENEVRYLPPIRRTAKRKESDVRTSDKSRSDAVALAYWRGIRDAATLALSFYEGGKQPEAQSLLRTSEATPSATNTLTWGLRAIGVASAFPPLSGRGIKVAVLDTGLDLDHPDFRNKVIVGTSARSFVSGVSVQDIHGHGTHCAGTVCGPRESVGEIRYGVAPDAELLVGKVFNNAIRPKATDDDILEGITWAEENGARVISMSLGSKRNTGGDFPVLYETIAKRLLNRQANSVLMVAAAGNASDRPHSLVCVENPAACPSIMAVAAIDEGEEVASFSCKRLDDIGAVDVSAPGVAVYSSVTGGGFEEFDGTSMAAPHVAGLAAL